ncbi:MAG: hypothetical protein WCY54_11390, partial [Syntrophales bacterium]
YPENAFSTYYEREWRYVSHLSWFRFEPTDIEFITVLRIPVKTATHSGAKRPPVPTQKSHPFRFKSAALSERSDAGFQSSFS